MVLDNIEVEIFSQKDTGEYVKKLLANNLIKINLNGFEIPCFTLEAEAQTYVKILD